MTTTYKMVDVGTKPVTHRVARASGEIELSAEVCRAISERRVPKGDVLALAEVAGISAAKKVSDVLPLCHPLVLDAVTVECELDIIHNRVRIGCEVRAHGRTGVEMEAMSGASGALLCVYDLTKGLDKGASISGIRLEYKEGGKSGKWSNPSLTPASEEKQGELSGLRSGVLTVSDRCSRGEGEDKSGRTIVDYLGGRGAEIAQQRVVPDEIELIASAVREMALERELDLVVVTGGTGVGPRDVTPEAMLPLWTKILPGFGETFRSRGLLNTPRAWLSRAEAGLVGGALVVLLPGSPSGVSDGLAVLEGMLPHTLQMIRGGGH